MTDRAHELLSNEPDKWKVMEVGGIPPVITLENMRTGRKTTLDLTLVEAQRLARLVYQEVYLEIEAVLDAQPDLGREQLALDRLRFGLQHVRNQLRAHGISIDAEAARKEEEIDAAPSKSVSSPSLAERTSMMLKNLTPREEDILRTRFAAQTPNIVLARGQHRTPAAGMDLLETVASVAGEPHSAYPKCVCGVLAATGRVLCDQWADDERQLLVQFVHMLINTRSTVAVANRRAYALADAGVRELAPMGLDAVGWHDLASRLREIRPIVDGASGEIAMTIASAVREDAHQRAYIEGANSPDDVAYVASQAATWTCVGTPADAAQAAYAGTYAAYAGSGNQAAYAGTQSAGAASGAAYRAAGAVAAALAYAFHDGNPQPVPDAWSRPMVIAATLRTYELAIEIR